MITRLYPKWDFLFFDLPYNNFSGSKTFFLISRDSIVN
jgi:hypothetical protein